MPDAFVARPVPANRGDLASQAGLVSALVRNELIRSVAVSTYYPHHYAHYATVQPITPPPVRGYTTTLSERRLLAQHPLVAWGGGVDLEDGGSKAKLLLLLLRLALLRAGSSPLLQAFQGVGPLTSRSGRHLAALTNRLFDHSIVREHSALELLRSLGADPTQLTLACDAAILLDPPDQARGAHLLSALGLDPQAPTLGLNLRRWYHQTGGWLPTQAGYKRRHAHSQPFMDQMIQNLQSTVQHLHELGFTQLVLLPMYLPEPEPWEDDILLLEQAAASLEDLSIGRLYGDIPPHDLISALSWLDLLVGVRLHSTILAHVAGVPSIHIAYAQKGQDYFRMMGLSAQCLRIEQMCAQGGDELLLETIRDTWLNRQGLSRFLDSQVRLLREQAGAALDCFIRATHTRGRG